MTMTDWAKKEVEIAKKECDEYYSSCMDSALKAFLCLMEDGHSGMSIGITKSILNRLIDGKCLTPIKDEDFDESKCEIKSTKEYLKGCGLKSSIQCPRMSSLFRDETLDGDVTYSDVGRMVMYDVSEPTDGFYNGFVAKVINEMFPITMPYYPATNRYKVYVAYEKTPNCTEDYDILKVLYAIKPDGERVEINRKFVENEKTHRLEEVKE